MVKKKTSIPLDDTPDVAQALGRLAGHWNVVELHLQGFFELLTLLDQRRGQAIFRSIISVSVRLDVLRRLIPISFVPEDLQKRMLNVLDEVQQLNKQRNEHMHAVWAAADPSTDVFRLSTMPPRPQLKKPSPLGVQLSADQVKAVVDAMAELSASLAELEFELAALPRGRPQRPDLTTA